MKTCIGRIGLLAAASLTGLCAQQFGEITGTVTDASGAVIVGAVVTATNTATDLIRTAATNTSGDYSLTNMPTGTYNLHVEKTGFKVSIRAGAEVQVGEVLRGDFALQLGDITQQVEVTGVAEQLNTESSTMGSIVAARQIVDLPLNGRDYLSLVTLSTNASQEGGATGGSGLQGGVRGSTSISIAGQRLEYNHYTLDGVDNTDPNFNSYIIHPSVDAIQEFKVQTGVYSAEFGRGASQINVNTLPGANVYHGAAFEFLRNDYFDAKVWDVAGPKAPFRRNDYGFTLDGPISIPKVFDGRNHLFFTSNFEALRDTTVNPEKASVAPTAMRQGNFSLTPGIQIIYDPATRIYPAGGTPSAQPFPGNIIPTSRISPQANILQSAVYMPLQTVPGNSLLNNYIGQSLSLTQSTQFNQRIDWNEKANSTWFGRFSWGSDNQVTGGTFYNGSTTVPTTVRQGVLANTRILSPTVVNDARFSWSQFNNFYTSYYSNNVDVQATLGIQGLTAPAPDAYGLPALGIPFAASGGATPWVTYDDSFQFIDGVSLQKGSHSIRIGGEIRRLRYNQSGNQKTLGEFDFDGGSTCNPASCTTATGYAYADFVLGLPDQALRVTQQADALLRSTFYAGYIQDDWKITRKLTLNIGLRYENQRPWVDKYNAMTNITLPTLGVGPNGAYLLANDAAETPILTRPGNQPFYTGLGFEYGAGQLVQNGNQMGQGLINPDNKNYGPRIGLAWAPIEHWSVRAGYGIFYVQDIGNAVFDMARNVAGRDGNVIANTARTTTLASPWASEVGSPACPGYNGPCLVAPQILDTYQGNRSQYVEQDLLVIQRELTHSLVLEAGYLGSEGHHLQRIMYLNQPVYPTSATDTSSIASRRPWPAYGPLMTEMNIVNSNYNSLEGKLSQRLSHGLNYSAGFTWSKSIDDGSGDRDGLLWPNNSYQLYKERGPSAFDVPLRVTANFVYDLPVGPGQAHVNHGILGAIIGGYQLGGIFTAYTGLPVQSPETGDLARTGTANSLYGDCTGVSPYATHQTLQNWWNAAAFDNTNPLLTWNPGNCGRDAFYGIGAWSLDLSVARTIKIVENHKLNLRLDAFNSTNHPSYNTPSDNYQSVTTFGIVTSAKTMRQLQLSLKYIF